MTEINFRNIRKHGTSREDGFEELCCQLFSLMSPEQGSDWIRKRGAGGDAGVEGYWKLPNGEEYALQAKYFFQFGSSQREQLTNSVQTMLEKHPKCTKYIICIPFNLGEQKQSYRRSQRDYWNELVDKWKQQDENREIDFELWDETKLTTFLSDDQPKYNGRRLYWFNQKILSDEWFENHLTEAVKNLGPRYTPDMNVDLPLSKTFTAARRGQDFWEGLKDLLALPSFNKEDEILGNLRSLVELINQITSTKVVSDQYSQIEDKISKVKSSVNELREMFYQNDGTQEYREFLKKIDSFLKHLELCKINYSVAPAILLKGDAGVGKSHILADTASQAINEKKPAVLLLGEQFTTGLPWQFVLNKMDFKGTQEDFLGALDACAQAKGCRALFAFDALNEGEGQKIWPTELPGFVERIRLFKNIVFVASCRSNYLRRIHRNLTQEQMLEIEHYGFKGHEELAATIYLGAHGINKPEAPLMDPEFSNPLFLKTFCHALKLKNETSFPKGLKGVTSIFKFYLSSVVETINLRLDLDPMQSLAQGAIKSLIDEILLTGDNYIPYSRATEIVDKIFPSNGSHERNILAQLVSEGVLSEDIIYHNPQDNEGINVIRVSYERYLDYLRAERFIEKNIQKKKDLDSAFSLDGPFRGMIQENVYQNSGFIDALSILIPEKFDTELYGLVESDDPSKSYSPLKNSLKEGFEESLFWRDPAKTNQQTLDMLNDLFDGICGESFAILVKCACSPQHILNAELLHKNLENMELAQRDKIWSIWISQNWYEPSEEYISPIWRVVDWAWNVNRDFLSDEQICLTCLTLAWFFSSPHRELRDRATKAMAAIVNDRVDIIRKLLLAFDRVNDPYIKERLYAVAYSAALSAKPDEVRRLARTVINRAFRSQSNFTHIMLRDYVRGIIQLASKLSVLPDNFELQEGHFFKNERSPIHNFLPSENETLRDELGSAYWSVMSGDFGTYVMNDVFHFSPTDFNADIPKTWGEIFDEFLEGIKGKNSEIDTMATKYLDALKVESEERKKRQPLAMRYLLGNDNTIEENNSGNDSRLYKTVKEQLEIAKENFVESLGEKDKEAFRWLNGGWGGQDFAKYSRRSTKRWVLNRVKELGWTKEKFKQYEQFLNRSGDRTNHILERIGKKYQWIAYHELLAILQSHQYYFAETHKDKFGKLIDISQLGRRDLDPTFLLSGNKKRLPLELTWWADSLPNIPQSMNRNEALDWIRNLSDLSSVFQGIVCTNPTSHQKFYVLDTCSSISQKGRESASWDQRHSKSVHTVILPISEIDTLKSACREENILNYLRVPDRVSEGFLGEYPWNKSWEEQSCIFEKIHEMYPLQNNLKAHYPVVNYFSGAFRYDCSLEDTATHYIPSKYLIEEFNLTFDRYKPFEWKKNESIIFCDPSVGTNRDSTALIDFSLFSEWLKEKEFVAVSSITEYKHDLKYSREQYLGELIDCQLSIYDGDHFSGERWTLLMEMGPTYTTLRTPVVMQGFEGN